MAMKQGGAKQPDPPSPRQQLLIALTAMPEEAFSYLVLACVPESVAPSAKIWPDGIGGFSGASKAAITAARTAAEAYLEHPPL
jgi:hypothetical protein